MQLVCHVEVGACLPRYGCTLCATLRLQPGDPLAMAVDGKRLILRKITLEDLLQESAKNYSEGKTLSHEETFKDLV